MERPRNLVERPRNLAKNRKLTKKTALFPMLLWGEIIAVLPFSTADKN